MSNPSPRRSNRRFGGFELLEKIGRGGMSSVYKARDLDTQNIVAVKIATRAVVIDPHLSRRFELEYNLALPLSHPNLVKVLGSGKHEDVPYLVMEYVDGPSLSQLLKIHAQLSEKDALALISSVADAVTYLHQKQIIHRDIKPANILLTSTGEAKLADLGLIKNLESLSRLTRSNIGLGTIQFASPEQFDDARDADARSDVYSLATTLYVMLTGEPPFGKGAMLSILNRKLQSQFDAPMVKVPTLTPCVDEAIRRAMQADRERRPATVNDFITLLNVTKKGKPDLSDLGPTLRPATISAALPNVDEHLGPERRRGIRHACELEARCRAVANPGGQRWPAWIIDLSVNGVCLRMPRRFEIGSGLEITFSVPHENQTLTQMAQVRWLKAAESKSWLLGCEFLNPIEPETLDTIIADSMDHTNLT